MKRIVLLIGGAVTSACTVGPNYGGPPAIGSAAVTRGSFVRATDPRLSSHASVARWWETLSDPLLTELIETALVHNPDIDIAHARIREVQHASDEQRALQSPSLGGSASYLHATLGGVALATREDVDGARNSSSSIDFSTVGLKASWEPDLFGGGRRSLERARAQVGQRFAELADVQVTLSAEVANVYVDLRATQEQIRLTTRSSELQHQSLMLMQQRFAAGTASALDVEALQSQISQADSQNSPLSAQINAYFDQLAVLTGRTPGALDTVLTSIAPVPLPPRKVPIGDPATLIARRPDVRSIERALAASTATIGIYKARQLPGLKFVGLLGLGGATASTVFDAGNLTTLIAPRLDWTFLDFGKNRAVVLEAESKRDEAEAQYRKTVLAALQDAETSLSRFGNSRQQLGHLAGAETAAAHAALLNQQRFLAGSSSLIGQITIERRHLSASISEVQGKAQLTKSYIAVQKALGLGWGDPAALMPGNIEKMR